MIEKKGKGVHAPFSLAQSPSERSVNALAEGSSADAFATKLAKRILDLDLSAVFQQFLPIYQRFSGVFQRFFTVYQRFSGIRPIFIFFSVMCKRFQNKEEK